MNVSSSSILTRMIEGSTIKSDCLLIISLSRCELILPNSELDKK